MADRRGIAQPITGARTELVRDAYAAYARGDEGWIRDKLAPAVEWHNPPYAIEAGVRHGPEEFLNALRNLRDAFASPAMSIIGQVREIDDQVVLEVQSGGTGQGSGLQIEGRFGHLWTVSEGRILRFAWFRSYDEALAAAAEQS